MANEYIKEVLEKNYPYGFVTAIEADSIQPGLSEETIRLISQKKEEPAFLLEWRLRAYRHWLTLQLPRWAKLQFPEIDFQDIIYYSAPKSQGTGPKSLDEVDPKLLDTYKRLGIPLHEQGRLAGVAVDAVFDSISVATTFKAKLAEAGVIFCPFSEALQKYPELVEKYLGTVVPYR